MKTHVPVTNLQQPELIVISGGYALAFITTVPERRTLYTDGGCSYEFKFGHFASCSDFPRTRGFE